MTVSLPSLERGQREQCRETRWEEPRNRSRSQGQKTQDSASEGVTSEGVTSEGRQTGLWWPSVYGED